MDTGTGQLYTPEEFKQMMRELPVLESARLKPVLRDLSQLEEATMQLRLYAPCGCGSGKKFKFCCYTGQ